MQPVLTGAGLASRQQRWVPGRAKAFDWRIPFHGPRSRPTPSLLKRDYGPVRSLGSYVFSDQEKFVLQAKASLGEYQPRHAAAKAVLQERKKLTDGLARPALPVPPRGTPREAQQLAAWKQLLAFERYTALTVVLCCSVDQGQDKRGIASCLHCTCCSSRFRRQGGCINPSAMP